jgi:hypothetical protein
MKARNELAETAGLAFEALHSSARIASFATLLVE